MDVRYGSMCVWRAVCVWCVCMYGVYMMCVVMVLYSVVCVYGMCLWCVRCMCTYVG